MNKLFQFIVIIAIAVVITLILDHLCCDSRSELKEVKIRTEKKIDSLNQVIKMREDSIRAIENQTEIIKTELSSLQEMMQQKDQQIEHYKKTGRFEYVHSADSLYRELNTIIKQRLSEDSSAINRLP